MFAYFARLVRGNCVQPAPVNPPSGFNQPGLAQNRLDAFAQSLFRIAQEAGGNFLTANFE